MSDDYCHPGNTSSASSDDDEDIPFFMPRHATIDSRRHSNIAVATHAPFFDALPDQERQQQDHTTTKRGKVPPPGALNDASTFCDGSDDEQYNQQEKQNSDSKLIIQPPGLDAQDDVDPIVMNNAVPAERGDDKEREHSIKNNQYHSATDLPDCNNNNYNNNNNNAAAGVAGGATSDRVGHPHRLQPSQNKKDEKIVVRIKRPAVTVRSRIASVAVQMNPHRHRVHNDNNRSINNNNNNKTALLTTTATGPTTSTGADRASKTLRTSTTTTTRVGLPSFGQLNRGSTCNKNNSKNVAGDEREDGTVVDSEGDDMEWAAWADAHSDTQLLLLSLLRGSGTNAPVAITHSNNHNHVLLIPITQTGANPYPPTNQGTQEEEYFPDASNKSSNNSNAISANMTAGLHDPYIADVTSVTTTPFLPAVMECTLVQRLSSAVVMRELYALLQTGTTIIPLSSPYLAMSNQQSDKNQSKKMTVYMRIQDYERGVRLAAVAATFAAAGADSNNIPPAQQATIVPQRETFNSTYRCTNFDRRQLQQQLQTTSTTTIAVDWFLRHLSLWIAASGLAGDRLPESALQHVWQQQPPPLPPPLSNDDNNHGDGSSPRRSCSLSSILQCLQSIQVLLPCHDYHSYQFWLPSWGIVLKAWQRAVHRIRSILHRSAHRERSYNHLMHIQSSCPVPIQMVLDWMISHGDLQRIERPSGIFIRLVVTQQQQRDQRKRRSVQALDY